MVANPERRVALTDCGLEILGAEGSRALTHRAVDRAAAVAVGTTANYFPKRADLFLAMTERVFALLAPDTRRLHELAHVPTTGATAEYAAYVTERLLARRHLAAALIELRLEAARSPEVGEVLAPFLRRGFADDIAFHHERGLPGGADTVLLLHHVVNGIVLDAITVPLDLGAAPAETARQAAQRLLG